MSEHRKRVDEILSTLRALVSEIPGYRASVSAREMRELVRYATVSRQFIEETAVAVEGAQPLRDASGFDPDDARDGCDFAEGYDTVADELELLARGVRYAAMRRRADIGRDALRTLAIAKALNRTGVVVPQLEIMRDALGGRRRRS